MVAELKTCPTNGLMRRRRGSSALTRTSDNSILDAAGKILYFSAIETIAEGLLLHVRRVPSLVDCMMCGLLAGVGVVSDSHARNPHEPLTDRFFVQLERDVLLVEQPLRLGTNALAAVIEIAELLPFDSQIAVGAAARKEAA